VMVWKLFADRLEMVQAFAGLLRAKLWNERIAVVTASARSFPVLIYSIEPAVPANDSQVPLHSPKRSLVQ
jgi:hypothetical protein